MSSQYKQEIVILIFIIPLFLGLISFTLNHPIGEGSVDTCKIEIIYHDSRFNENVSCAETIIEGMPFYVCFELRTDKELRYEIWRKENDCDMEVIDELQNVCKIWYVFQFEKGGLIGLARKPMDICLFNPIVTIIVHQPVLLESEGLTCDFFLTPIAIIIIFFYLIFVGIPVALYKTCMAFEEGFRQAED